ncbi:hypothetical protein GGS23DRAFT_619609 [Durotheca rogersii]|uniref:uncharacterized protein n=1 Tax=Durotheca rogersii TaxID=419775 RepID=UPI00221ED01F|nr:uncharacterized protein GGS23DRAFT_619609 [Durotheca rogersii]KAI5864900.1 hypothetical protein GGS23DRAFT_619609 [Durotheca rogersii]
MGPGTTGTRDNGPSFWPEEAKLLGFKAHIGKYYSSPMRPGVLLKLNHYPAALPELPGSAGIHAHSDLERFTILCQDDVKSLGVLSKDGGWVPADPTRGFSSTSNTFLSVIHRAYNREGRRWYSVPFFGADYDAVTEAPPNCVSAAPPARYAPVTAGEHVRQKLCLTYPIHVPAA